MADTFRGHVLLRDELDVAHRLVHVRHQAIAIKEGIDVLHCGDAVRCSPPACLMSTHR